MRDTLTSIARIMGSVLAVAPFLVPAARAGTTSSGFNTSGTVGYSSNPFLLETPDGGVVRATVSVSPFVEEKTARSSLRISATAALTKYSRRYDEAVDLSSQVGYSNMLTRQLSFNAGLSLNSSIGGSYFTDPIFAAPVPNAPVQPIVDITLVGLQNRTTSVQGNTGFTYSPNSKNTFTLGNSASVARFPGSIGRNEYTTISQSLGYSRVLNSRLNGGASVNVTRVNYLGSGLGDATIINPSFNGSWRVNSRWSLTGGIGFSTSRVNILGGSLTSTDLSGSLNACRSDTRTNFCLNAARSAGASSFDGVRTTTFIGTTYSYKITPRDTISASGGYSQSPAPRLSNRGVTSFLSGSTTYSRQLTDRMSGQVSGGFSRSGFDQTRSNAFASIGINYGFGAR